MVDLLLSRNLIKLADSMEIGIPSGVRAQMSANLIVDFAIGLIPIVGAVGDMIYKANTRNLRLLEKYIETHHPADPGTQPATHATTANIHA